MNKEDLIKKLKAFILDEGAFESEQDNAIKILLKLKDQGINIGEIPEKVRPKQPIVLFKKSSHSIEYFYKYIYKYEKIPYKKQIKPIFSLDYDEYLKSIEKGNNLMGGDEIVYKTIFQKYEFEYVDLVEYKTTSFEVIKMDRIKTGTKLIQESELPIDGIDKYHPYAFDEKIKDVYIK